MPADESKMGGREARFPGIGRRAKALGYSRVHLFLVLTGQRPNPGLVKKYKELLSKEQAATTPHPSTVCAHDFYPA